MQLVISFSARRVALILGGISLYLSVHSIVGKAIEYELGTHSTYLIYQLVRLFNVNREASIPAWYSASLLLLCSVLLATIAHAKRRSGDRYIGHWTALAMLFLYLSADEAAEIHEKLTIPLQEALNSKGYFYFAWVIVGAVFVLVVGLAYLRFFWHLPPRSRAQFLLAGMVYVGGALVIESISAKVWYEKGGTSLTFSAIGTVEELGEMLGLVIFVYALLCYMSSALPMLQIVIMPNGQPPSTESYQAE